MISNTKPLPEQFPVNVPVTLVSCGHSQWRVRMSVYKMQLSSQPCKHTCYCDLDASVGDRFAVFLILVKKNIVWGCPPMVVLVYCIKMRLVKHFGCLTSYYLQLGLGLHTSYEIARALFWPELQEGALLLGTRLLWHVPLSLTTWQNFVWGKNLDSKLREKKKSAHLANIYFGFRQTEPPQSECYPLRFRRLFYCECFLCSWAVGKSHSHRALSLYHYVKPRVPTILVMLSSVIYKTPRLNWVSTEYPSDYTLQYQCEAIQ